MAVSGGKTKTDLTTGPIFRTLLVFAMPILLGSIITQLYNVADSIVVGRFKGTEALAAVSAATPVMSIINLFMIGLSSGSNVVIAQHAGSGDTDVLQKSVETISCLTLLCSAFITVFGLVICRPLLRLLGTPEEILADSVKYLVVIFLGTTGNLVYQMGSGALRGMGDSKWPFYFLVLCSFLNIGFDLIAVIVLDMGVFGVAIATAVAQLISGIGIIYRMNHGGYPVRVGIKRIALDRQECSRILNIGLPAAIQNIGNSLAALFVQSSVNVFGSTFISANSIVSKIENIIYIPFMALATALATFVGQNMGRFRMERIRKGINYSIISLCGLGVFLCLGLIALRNVFPYIFTEDELVAEYASAGLFIMSFSCLFCGADRVLVHAMRGAGKSIVPMITAQFGAFSRIPLAYFLGARTGNYRGIFYAMLIATFLRCAAIVGYYYLGGWKRAVAKFRADYLEKHPDAVIEE